MREILDHYYAVVRTGQKPNDEIRHWKYIKRVKKNGKWKYFYDDREVNKYKRNEIVVGGKNSDATFYTTTNRLFNYTDKSQMNLPGNKKVTINVKYQGKLSRVQAKGEKFVYDTFLEKRSIGNRTRRNLTRARNRGKNYLRKLLNKR